MSEPIKTAISSSFNRFKSYSEYKDSGVGWLGKIPAHWEMKRFGFNAEFIVPMRDKPKDLTGSIPWIRIEDFDGREIEKSKSGQGVTVETIREMNLKVFPVGTVLCSCSCDMGATAIVRAPLVSNQTFIGIVPGPKLHSDYIYYLMQVAKPHLTELATGAIQQYLSRNHFSSLRMPYLPIGEQRNIATFLDRETRKIDVLITRKERLIELLQEKRTALISQAVTKGLDHNVPIKDSGVEWLGEIPAHWNLIPLKYCAVKKANAIKTGPFGSQLLSSEMMSGEVKVYNQRTVLDHDFISGDNYITEDKFKDLISFMVEPGDILLTTRGTIGRCAIVPKDAENGILHPCLMRIQPDISIIVPEYLVLLLQDSILVQTQIKLASNATTIDVIYSETMKEIKIPLPPLQEQLVITAAIDRETSKIDAMILKVREAIDCLKEYRTALISAAVTGKIDVRGEVP